MAHALRRAAAPVQKAVNLRAPDFTALRQIAMIEWLGAAIHHKEFKIMRRIIVLAVACAIPGALFAQTASASTAPAATAEKPAQPKKLCRREETTGSMLQTRICHTKDEWVQIDAATRKNADQFNTARNNNSGHGPS